MFFPHWGLFFYWVKSGLFIFPIREIFFSNWASDFARFLNHDAKIRHFPDTTKFQRVIRCDFQHAFNPKPVKQSNSPFCAPQLILFQKRKHRVERLNTISTTNNKIQNGIRNLPQFLSSSVPQFFSDPSLLSLFRSLLYI